MELFPLTYHEFKSFFLILIRVSVVLFMFPFFSARVIPVVLKAGLALITAIVLFPVLHLDTAGFPETTWGMLQLILSEFIVGMILGLLVQMVFEAFRMVGYLVGFQAGFAMANVLDPLSGTQVSILSNLSYYVAIVVFLLLDGHHIAIRAIKESFGVIQVGSLNLRPQAVQQTIRTFGSIFVIALKMGAPAIAALLLINVAFGLIAKLMPQMNIMIVGFPVKIVVGLVFFGIGLGIISNFMEKYTQGLNTLLLNMMFMIKG